MEVVIKDITGSVDGNTQLTEGKVKIIVLDGVKDKIMLLTLPEHGQTVLETAKGAGHKVKYMVGEFLLK